MTTRTVYLVDDNVDFLQSAEYWLQGAGFDVKSFGDPQQALDALTGPQPLACRDACLLLDVRMPGMSGLEVHDRLLSKGVNLPVVYMTGHGDVPLAVEAMRKGAVTFIEKPFADEALESALELAFRERPVPPAAAVVDAGEPAATQAAQAAPPDAAEAAFAERMARLTGREREVIDWVVKGKLNKVIADLLGISIKTVELHRKNAMTKLQARSVIDLTRLMVTGKVVS
jgi:two-component system response regulator FixJ